MSVHTGTLGGWVGDRYHSIDVATIHCDGTGCDEVLCAESCMGSPDSVLSEAESLGWVTSEDRDLCPDCARESRRGGAR